MKTTFPGRRPEHSRCSLFKWRHWIIACVFVAAIVPDPSRVSAATFTVVNTNLAGPGSLQQAIFDANTNAGTDTINFAITNASLTIGLSNALPTITEPVTIDGATQTGFAGAPIVELNGTSAGAAVDGLKINTSNCVVRSLVINRFSGDGIEITNGANNSIGGCYIGLNLAGTTDQGNSLNGVFLTNAANNTIGGIFSTQRNYISGNNANGILLGGASATNNLILGNIIGLNITSAAIANSTDGVRINGPYNMIGGSTTGARNVISGNSSDGIELALAATNTVIKGNYIGTDTSGTLDRGNTADGVFVNTAPGVVIGGTLAGEGNLISGNNNSGIELSGGQSTNNVVLGNIIGTDATRTMLIPNSLHGVLITSNSRSNLIGGVLAGEANSIWFNTQDGVNIVSGTNNTIRGNSIFANGTSAAHIGIDIGSTDGISANDAGDADVGANQLQNFPVLTSVSNSATEVTIVGSLNSRPSITYTVDFYSSLTNDLSGSGEGQTWFASTNLTTGADSNVNFTVSFTITLSGRSISATATDPAGNTSEFSANVASVSTAAGQIFTVINTNDSGAGSLREAINNANLAVTTGDRIEFNIPGSGVQTNSPATALPEIVDTVTIDGYTQPGSATNTSSGTFNGAVAIRIDGNSAGTADGLRLVAGSGHVIRGLMITRFNGDGIEMVSTSLSNRIEGCIIGLDSGATDQGNSQNGILVNSAGNVIGGTSSGARNVISGSTSDGVEINGAGASNNIVSGNLIGTDFTGTLGRNNSAAGVLISTAPGVTVGGVTAGTRNLISANSTHGISLVNASGATIQGNYLGTDVSGALDLGNGSDGINVNGSTNSVIGGTAAGAGNLISGNNSDGIEFTGLGATNNIVQGNYIGTDASGTNGLPNSATGVNLNSNARANRIGGIGAGEGNTIAFNLDDGIAVATGTNNTFRGNAIFSNGNSAGEIGIDLGTSGVTANDVGDADAGANQLQNFPILSSALNSSTGTVVTGTLNSATNRSFEVDFYSNITPDGSGNGQGQYYLGSTNVTTDGNGDVSITALLAVTNLAGRYITATATDTNGNTSEFATNVYAISSLPGQTFAVLNTNNSGPGSLRQAIADANTAINSGDTIVFAITNLTTTIVPTNALPTIIDPVSIDGYTQPGSATNTSSTAFNGVLPVRIDGVIAGTGTDGLKFTIGGNTVRGLMITRFSGDGLDFSGGGTNNIQGCVIGLDAAGTDQGCGANGILFTASGWNTIGGTSTGSRNVISGNNSDGIEITAAGSSNNTVLGNLLGTDFTGGISRNNSANGIQITSAPNTTIGSSAPGARNVISANSSSGIGISTSSDTIIQGNYVGTDASGTADLGNGTDGINLNGSANGMIGGGSPGTGNLISGNGNDGIELTGLGTSNNIVQGNRIGTDVSGTSAIANSGPGVNIGTSARANRIGGIGAGEANVIAFNQDDGVQISSGTNNVVRGNSIYANGNAVNELGIDLGTAGVSANETGDADTGANQLQNFPILYSASNSLAGTVINGILSSATNRSFDLDFYSNVLPDNSGSGQGQVYIGSTNITTDGNGEALFVAILPVTNLTGRYITATATDTNGNTSEFSTNVFASSTLAGQTFIVVNTNNSGPGSLRQAITDANAAINSGDTITFAITNLTTTIVPTNALPTIIDSVTIDGYTQPGSATNTSSTAFNGVLPVRIDGVIAGTGTDGLKFTIGGNIVRGLMITRFNGDGLEFSSGGTNQVEGCVIGLDAAGTDLGNNGNGLVFVFSVGNTIGGASPGARNVISGNNADGVSLSGGATSNNIVLGNLIGTDLNGTVARGNSSDGVEIGASAGNLIGGSTAGARNIISGNNTTGININAARASNNIVVGNFIGLDVSGTLDLGNGGAGITIATAASFNTVGGISAGARNIISGNGGAGISIGGNMTGTIIQGNYIGTDVTGTLNVGNSDVGIGVNNTTASVIGGTGAGAANIIAFNLNDGVQILSGTNNMVRGNSIHSNGNAANELGIDLGTTGVSANDVGDADSGANQLQNFPILTSALNSLAGTVVTGTLNSATNQSFDVDFYSNVSPDGSGCGQGQVYLGSTNVTTDGSGNVTFTGLLTVTNLTGRYLSATATDANGNTSEFGTNVLAVSTILGQTFTVINTNDSGPGSLRQAISDANANISAGDTITFAITNLGTTISPGSALPTIIDPVTIDGYTQPGSATNTSSSVFNGTLPVRLDGVSVGVGVDGLKFTLGGNTVRGIMITRFNGDGMDFSGGGSNVVQGCVIGLDALGVDVGNNANGILFTASSNNVVGGISPGLRNVISGNNSDGIEFSGSGSSNNVVLGNLIGTDPGTTVDRGNSASGILVSAAPGNAIGGTATGSRNIISGNNDGGIKFLNAGASNNVVLGNYIGLDGSGTVDRPNSGSGVECDAAPRNIIGGSAAGARNIISGNTGAAVEIWNAGGSGNLIQGNYLGTDVSGTLSRGNFSFGVIFHISANGNTLGGATAAEGNLISGNTGHAVSIDGANSTNNIVANNFIGTDVTGTLPLGNGGSGVLITGSAHHNTVGGGGNTIAFNLIDGVRVVNGANNSIRKNLIFENGGLGIELGLAGVTPNDPGDPDTAANQLQNFPILLAATNSSTNVVIMGMLNSITNTTFEIEFYCNQFSDPSGNGEGQQYLGTTNVTTDGSGNCSFTADFPAMLQGRHVTATATDPFGNTSEFATNILAVSTIPSSNFVVTTIADSGTGSLREIITLANAWISAGNDTISFAIPGAGPHTILPTSALPMITDPVTIDAFTQSGASSNTLAPGNNALLKVNVDGSSAGTVDGLRVATDGCIIRGLSITRFQGDGISIENGAGNRIEGCYLGLATDGATVKGNTENGVLVLTNASQSSIGGATPGARCLISGNTHGIYLDGSSSNLVQGCYVGTDGSGLLDRGNTNSGIFISRANAKQNTIGGTSSATRNVISGNGEAFSSEGNGITLSECISNSIIGNYIGTTATGSSGLGNQQNGISLWYGASTNFIGGEMAGAGNVISANSIGVNFSDNYPDQSGNFVFGNLIGTDAMGTSALGNFSSGLSFSFADGNRIGGPRIGQRNVISGNFGTGVNINPSAATGNIVQGNYIGTDISGTNSLGNGGPGVDAGSSYTVVGGTNAGDGNVIAFNAYTGVSIFGFSSSCSILGNSIHSNGGLGIDLYITSFPIVGVSANDIGDADTGGNGLQNYPVLTNAFFSPLQTVIEGRLNSAANSSFHLEFFDNGSADTSGFGEGQTYLGFTDVMTDGTGNATFAFVHPAALGSNHVVTATATDVNNNTSEFSAARAAVPYDTVDLILNLTDSGDPVACATNFTYSITITNDGPTNATSVVVTDWLPANVNFVSATPSQGTATNSSGIVTWNAGTLNFGGTATLSIAVMATASGSLSNFASVTAFETDNNPSNNSDIEYTQAGVADLAVSTVDSPDPVVAGQPLTNVVTITNFGPDNATNVSLNYNSYYSSIIASVGVSQGSYYQSGVFVSCSFGTISNGMSATLTVVSYPTASGSIYDIASVTATEADPFTGNNVISEPTSVIDGPGILHFYTSTYSVNENGGAAAILIQRDGGAIGTVTAVLSSTGITATATADYASTNITVTLTNGETSKTALIPIVDDLYNECNEEFAILLSNPTGGAVMLNQTNANVWIFDNEVVSSGSLQAVSVINTNLPVSAGNRWSVAPSISADGRYVAYASLSANLTLNDSNFDTDIFVNDAVTHSNHLVSATLAGASSTGGYSQRPRISGDGRLVVYQTYAPDLVANDTNEMADIIAHDRGTGSNILVSVNAAGSASGNSASYASVYPPTVSSNTLAVAFESFASDLTLNSDANSAQDVFVRNLANNTTWLASLNLAGTASGNNQSYYPVISGNGGFLAFLSSASDLVANDSNFTDDVFVRDLTNGITTLVSVNSAGSDSGNNISAFAPPAISGDGRYVAFVSFADNLATNVDLNGQPDVYWRDLQSGVTRLVSVSTNGNSANGYSTLIGLSANGRYALFNSYANDLVAGDTNSTQDVFVRDMTLDVTTLVSVNSSGSGPGNGSSLETGGISDDGRYVTFSSYATDLVTATKQPFIIDVFVRDLVAGTTTLISSRSGSTDGGNDDSYEPVISANGNVAAFSSTAQDIASIDHNGDYDVFSRNLSTNATTLLSFATGMTSSSYSYDSVMSANGSCVAFTSYGYNLALEDTNNTTDIFLRDLASGSNLLVSVTTSGAGSGNGYSETPAVSADGRYVAFYSEASNLAAGDTNNAGDVFLRDTAAGVTLRLSVSSNGLAAANSGSFNPHMSPDGRFVVFESGASNIATNDLNGFYFDIFLRDSSNSVPELITVNGAGSGSVTNDSFAAVVSDEGYYVAFESYAGNFGPADSNDLLDIYVRDRVGGTNILCSPNLAGNNGGNGHSTTAFISANGRYVFFNSDASDLVVGDTNNATDIFRFDVITRGIQLVSVNSNGVPGNSYSYLGSISPDGRYAAFESGASDLVSTDANDADDVFVRDLVAGTTTLVSANCNGTGGGNDYSYLPAISADGRYVAFESYASDLAPGDYGAAVENVFRRDLLSGTTVLVSQNRVLTGGGNDHSYYAHISTNGAVVSFESDARDLVAADANNNTDIFVWNAAIAGATVDLVLDKSSSTNSTFQFDPFSYVITVTNQGAGSATGVVVSDTLPAGLTFNSAIASQGTITNSGGTVTAGIGTLNVGQGASVTITVTATNTGTITNTASTAAVQTDSSPANNSDSAAVTIVPLVPPPLFAAVSGVQLQVFWPGSIPNVFTLESTTSLAPVSIWTPVTNSVSIVGTNRVVIFTPIPVEPARFFRLKH